MTTDADGQASITTGLGDLLVWACKDGKYGYEKIDVRKNDKITLKLTHTEGGEYVENLEINPPAGKFREDDVTDEELAANAKRLAYEDSIRNAYLATFPTKENFKQMIKPNANFTDDQAWEIIHKSEGNYAEIIKFINNNTDSVDIWKLPASYDIIGILVSQASYHPRIYEYLRTYSDKDLRDITADVLDEHFLELFFDEEWSLKGILPARISNEMVRPYREELRHRQLLPLSHLARGRLQTTPRRRAQPRHLLHRRLPLRWNSGLYGQRHGTAVCVRRR